MLDSLHTFTSQKEISSKCIGALEEERRKPNKIWCLVLCWNLDPRGARKKRLKSKSYKAEAQYKNKTKQLLCLPHFQFANFSTLVGQHYLYRPFSTLPPVYATELLAKFKLNQQTDRQTERERREKRIDTKCVAFEFAATRSWVQ